MADLTGFLKPTEKKQLQSMYEKWLEEINIDTLIVKMYKCGLVSNYDRQRIDAERTPMGKAQIIFHDVLMRSPYEDLSKIRRLLVETRRNGNIALAKMFPDRGEPIDFTPPPYHSHADDKVSEQCTDAKTEHPDMLDLVGEPMDYEVAKNAGFFKNKKADDVPRITTYYERKPANRASPYGKGLCVVIRNFSEDLPGYANDALRIRNFFGRNLGYEVLEGSNNEFNLVNLNRAEFHLALNKIFDRLSDPDANYDRFFLFILSHGDHKGLIMSQAGNGHDKEEGTRYPVDDIISKFSHDSEKLPALKQFPKCFYIQACRGDEVAKSAAYSDSPAKPPKPIMEQTSIQVTVGADVLVCFPSQMGFLSWVPSTGSWFIQESMAIFEKFHISTHVLDMMTEVAKGVSKIYRPGHTKSTADGSTFVQESVCQMPHVVSTLTDRFFLVLPPNK